MEAPPSKVDTKMEASKSKVDLVESLVAHTEGWHYEEELQEKVSFVRDRFPEIEKLDVSKFLVLRSPDRHFRFRTAISVLPRCFVDDQLLPHPVGRSWLQAVYDRDAANRVKVLQEAVEDDVVKELRAISIGHFIMFDCSSLTRPSADEEGGLVVRDVEPERMCIETLSRGIVEHLRNQEFLRRVYSELYLTNLGLVVIRLHSTTVYERDVEANVPVEVRKTSASNGGLVCSFILNAPENFGQTSLIGFSDAHPCVRFVVQAKGCCKSALKDVLTLDSSRVLDNGAAEARAKEVVQKCILPESLRIKGRDCNYMQIFDSFSNPNPYIAIATGEWLQTIVEKYSDCDRQKHDEVNNDTVVDEGEETTMAGIGNAHLMGKSDRNLLELYCGIGSHTVALGPAFDQIVAVEIDPNLVQMLETNIGLNGNHLACGTNVKPTEREGAMRDGKENASIRDAKVNDDKQSVVHPIRAPSEDFCRRIMKHRKYKDICFNWIVVDPPRAGLDGITKKLIRNFPHILYISCNPAALRRDLDDLLTEFELVEFCVLDHFPFTPHIENGVYLRKWNP